MAIGKRVNELLAHGADLAQIMMLGHEPASPGAAVGRREQVNLARRQRAGFAMAGAGKTFFGQASPVD